MVNILNDFEFEQHLARMGNDQAELLRFVARQQYQMAKLCPIHSQKIKALEHSNKKTTGVVGGIGAVIGVAVASALDFFLRRG